MSSRDPRPKKPHTLGETIQKSLKIPAKHFRGAKGAFEILKNGNFLEKSNIFEEDLSFLVKLK